MEEDIKILEEFTESSCCLASQEEIIECVKNLIKGYRELDEIYERLLKEYELRGEHIAIFKKDYIPNSKIKEIKTENEKRIDKLRPYKHQAPFDFGVLNGIDECCRKLLEDK